MEAADVSYGAPFSLPTDGVGRLGETEVHLLAFYQANGEPSGQMGWQLTVCNLYPCVCEQVGF